MLDSDDMALAHAIWLNVYDGKECDPRCLEMLVGYTRKQVGGARNWWVGLETDGWDRKQMGGARNWWMGQETDGWG